MRSDLTSFEKFAETVHSRKQPESRLVNPNDEFGIVVDGASTCVTFAGLKTGALPMYQVKAATGASNLNIRDTEKLLQIARAGDEKRAAMALNALKAQVDGLNIAIRGSDFSTRKFITRIFEDECGRPKIGGIVSNNYESLTHAEYVDRCMELPEFRNALVHRWDLNESRMDFTIMLSDQEWAVDGGIKSGLIGGNGQFGDKATGLVAMLFRLLCTNGMMDVVDSSGFKRRHSKGTDLSNELSRVLKAASSMFDAAKASMLVEINVIEALVGLYRRGVINRGAFRKTLERCLEEFDGVTVSGAVTTRWGLSQAITAAARDYGFTQMQSMGRLAGEIVRNGTRQIEMRHPILDTVKDWAELLDQHGRVIDTRIPVTVSYVETEQ